MDELLYSPERDGATASREALWDQLADEVGNCQRCPLGKTRTKPVFGEGPRDASLVFIGEGPGADEDASGQPFVGKAGRLLTDVLGAAGIDRKDVFIGNIVKCRPPENRVPTLEEMLACDRYLQTQLTLLSPRILVCLGNTPTKWILRVNEGITAIRGKWFSWRGIDVMPMFHPSYLLRNQSRAVGSPKHQTWLDIKEVKKRWDSYREGQHGGE